MVNEYDNDYLMKLIAELMKLPSETEWVEYKENNANPEEIGEYVSALSNSAALHEQPAGYLVWGVRDSDKRVVGSTFDPATTKVGNEDFEPWLTRLLSPQVGFSFNVLPMHGINVVLLKIEPAASSPVRFRSQDFIRIGSYKKNLKDFPDHERRLWLALGKTSFEEGVAYQRAEDDGVLRLLDYPSYFDLIGSPLPENRSGILEVMHAEGFIRKAETGEWNVTNLGALLFAKDMGDFPSLARKRLRVVQYRGNNRIDTIREQVGVRGYASGFEGAISYIMTLLPSNEVIGQALRQTLPLYPELAIRELVANALIHQDLTASGSGPMVELFDDRIEITSPGGPLVDPLRFVDAPPRSRNEKMAALMRRIGVCEERGSGWDKIAFEIEFHQLPAPLVEVPEGFTRVVVSSPKTLQQMDKEDRVRATYLHACLRQVSRQYTTNTSVRERFKIEQRNSATASRIISDAVEAGRLVPYDPDAAKSQMRYQPFWAGGGEQAVI